ncbi:MAG: tetratricopeptide repeat protein [Bacteroidia bacterium]
MQKKQSQKNPEKEHPKKYFFTRKIKISFFLIALCILIYGNGIKNNFALDDEFVTLNNPQIEKGFKGIPEIFTTRYAVNQLQNYGYRPIVKVTYAIEYQLFGKNPHISHFINILIYALTCIFLFFLLEKLFKNAHFILPLLITILFLVLPLHSEVVDSLKNRDCLLSFFGSLVSLYFFLKYTESEKIRFLFFGSFVFAFAWLSKMDVMTFLAIIPLTLYFFTKTTPKKIFFVIGAILIGLIAMRIGVKLLMHDNPTIRSYIFIENPLYIHKGNLFSRIPIGFFTLAYYYKLLVFPVYLTCYYGYNTIPITEPNYLIILVSGIFTLAITGWAVYKIKTKKIIFFGILYFFITASMFLNVVVPAVGIIAERFMYIPSLGFCIVVAILIFDFFKIPYKNTVQKINFSEHKNFFFLVSILLVLCSCRVIIRNPDWKNHYTLYAHDIKNVPESAKLHALLAAKSLSFIYDNTNHYSQSDKVKFANDVVTNYEDAIRIYPDYVTSLNNLGMAYYAFFKRYKEAMPLFEKALAIDSTYVEAYYNLAFCRQLTGDFPSAEKLYLKSIALRPDFLKSYTNLTVVYISEQRYDEAINLNQNAIIAGYKSSVYYVDIGNVYMARKAAVNAIQWYKKGLEIDPENEDIKKYLANYYRQNKP